jgi:hypothetical protein
MVLSFAEPMNSIGADHPGGLEISIYNGASLIHIFNGPSSGYGNFTGLISDAPFDRAIVWDPQGGTTIDDLHFGTPIPAPPVGALMALGLGLQRKGRSRRA